MMNVAGIEERYQRVHAEQDAAHSPSGSIFHQRELRHCGLAQACWDRPRVPAAADLK
jgi:hypothetical protein